MYAKSRFKLFAGGNHALINNRVIIGIVFITFFHDKVGEAVSINIASQKRKFI
jgi:hypothetical protein